MSTPIRSTQAPERSVPTVSTAEDELPPIDTSHLITEDDEPVESLEAERQRRLLTNPLYEGWTGPSEGRTFVAAANVGVFPANRNPAIVPDVLLSLDVTLPAKVAMPRSYFNWEFGKPIDVAIEIVSLTPGGEDDEKKAKYARMRVSYYVIFDPLERLGETVLKVYRLASGGRSYEVLAAGSSFPEPVSLPDLELGLTLWEGEYEGIHSIWLRWTDKTGALIPTGKERAEAERGRAEAERGRAEAERARAEAERERANAERKRAKAAAKRADEERHAKEAALTELEELKARLRELEGKSGT